MQDPISLVLDDLLKLDDILACMVARRSMIGITPTNAEDNFEPKINQVFELLA